MSRRFWLAIAVLLLLGGGFPTAATAQSHHKLIVIVANRLLLSDLSDPSLPTVSLMLQDGAVGLVSANCSGPKNEGSVMLTAAVGASSRAGSYIGQFYDAGELVKGDQTAGDAYRARTGHRVAPGSAVFLGLGLAQRDLLAAGGQIKFGTLGDAIHRAGLRTCVVGNADLPPDTIDRAASVLACDSWGRIDVGRERVNGEGENGEGLSREGEAPAEPQLEQAIRDCARHSDFIVVNYGDTVRLDNSKPDFTDQAYATAKKRVLRNLDRTLATLLQSPETKDLTLVLVSFSPSLAAPWDRLTPVVVYPSAKSGMLTSPSTRTDGLIAASDFAPTVLSLMNVRGSDAFVGRPAREVESGNKLGILNDMETRVAANHTLIYVLLWIYALSGAVSITTAALLLAFSRPISRRLSLALRIGMLIAASAMLSMLLAVLAPAGVAGYTIGALVVTALAVTASLLVGGRYAGKVRALPVLIIFGLTVIAIVVDAEAGGHLCKFSLPSSYQLDGFRYYGIGNEYAGALISMAALVWLFLSNSYFATGKPRRSGWDMAAFVILFALAAGDVGANYGGAFAVAVTVVLIIIALQRGGFGARHVAQAAILGAVLVGTYAVADLRTAGSAATHAGRVTEMAGKLGDSYLGTIVIRKVGMNVRTIVCRTAQLAYMVFAPFLVLWFWGLQGKVKAMIGDPRAIAGFKALMVGTVAAFLFNDSGIVIGGIMVAMTVLVLLYSLLEASSAPVSAEPKQRGPV